MTTATKKVTRLNDADCLDRDDLAELPVETLRHLFRLYRKAALYLISRDELDLHFARVEPVEPADWIVAVRSATGTCDRCSGRGIYYWGACVNGKMSHSAPCARCNGKGQVDINDCRRAYGYDNYAIAKAFGF